MASAIVQEVADGREPGPQSPYETRLTGEFVGQVRGQHFDCNISLWGLFSPHGVNGEEGYIADASPAILTPLEPPNLLPVLVYLY